MRKRKTSTKKIIRHFVLKRCFFTMAFFGLLVIGAAISPAARLVSNGKLMVDHKIIISPGGILLSGDAKTGGAK